MIDSRSAPCQCGAHARPQRHRGVHLPGAGNWCSQRAYRAYWHRCDPNSPPAQRRLSSFPLLLPLPLRKPHVAIQIIVLATIYVLAARLGLAMDAVSGFATLVWPPTGIALAALVLRGYRLWPGIAIGAFVVNLMTGAPPLVALGISAGNTLEALLGVWLLNRVEDFDPRLGRLRDVLAFLGFACVLSPTVAATVGVLSLHAAHMIPTGATIVTWQAWWVGDLMGALLIAPPLLIWTLPPWPRFNRPEFLEATALALTLTLVGLIIFADAFNPESRIRVAYPFFPVLGWAAMRFGQRGAVTATLLTSIIAIWGTASGRGPFAQPELYRSLFAVQTFMAVAATSCLVFGAAIAEREAAEQALRAAHTMVTTANRAKADFLAVMSHELRTPLNAISGYVDLLALGVDGPLAPKQHEALARIQRSQAHLLSLIEDILGFAKIEAGRVRLAPEPLPAGDVVRGVLPLIEPDAERKRITLTVGDIGPSVIVRADPEKLRQILVNLLTNAVKFTAAGGSVRIDADREFDRVRFRVTDTGIGIPPDQLARVFEPFVQLEHGRTRRYSGIGLGLSITRDLAIAMGGEVKLDSKVGEGTTVSVFLPTADSRNPTPPSLPVTEPVS